MTSDVQESASGYWYEDDSNLTGVDVLNALRRYRTAESAAQRRARESLGIGENALATLRILLEAERQEHLVNAKELAERLGVTAASTSAIVDRLVRSGHVQRNPDPNDRRGVILTATGPAMPTIIPALEELDQRTLDVVDGFEDDELSVIQQFFEAMTRSVELDDVRFTDNDGRNR
jgi:DNA-binding MarR family transcriptional regulator